MYTFHGETKQKKNNPQLQTGSKLIPEVPGGGSQGIVTLVVFSLRFERVG